MKPGTTFYPAIALGRGFQKPPAPATPCNDRHLVRRLPRPSILTLIPQTERHPVVKNTELISQRVYVHDKKGSKKFAYAKSIIEKMIEINGPPVNNHRHGTMGIDNGDGGRRGRVTSDR
ncbi:hypothetical protein EVAR_92612_1 [Eumeta japonica]|uniref:Uncharacterized protein n=1 Tax=Eumeta variegata TaxID=151549 RepID=A0A4C1T057_EUMVA|nr:hypothetical protein EVAR_92612_1 [Eumeta japonica]